MRQALALCICDLLQSCVQLLGHANLLQLLFCGGRDIALGVLPQDIKTSACREVTQALANSPPLFVEVQEGLQGGLQILKPTPILLSTVFNRNLPQAALQLLRAESALLCTQAAITWPFLWPCLCLLRQTMQQHSTKHIKASLSAAMNQRATAKV